MERLRLQVDSCVGSGIVLFVNQPIMLVVQPMFSGKRGVAAITVPWEVEGFEAVAVAGVVGELFL